MALATVQSVALSAQGAGTVNGSALDLGSTAASGVGVLVSVTAVGGTPTLDVKLQWSADNVTFGDADVADAFTQITAVKTTARAFTPKARYVRAVAVVAGTTPSVTGVVVLTPTP